MLEELKQEWGGSTWDNDWKNTYTYVGNNMIEELRQNWANSNWVNHLKETYTYDGSNNMIEHLNQEWRNNNWVDFHKHTFTYDVNNNLLEELHECWDGMNWIIFNRSIYSYIPTDVEQLADGIRVYSLSNNYPNPFNPTTTINYQIQELSFVTLKVYDVLGNEVSILVNEERPAGKYEVEFNGSELTSGIYFYQMKTGSFIETKKMVLIK
ncbi:MAG: T9SS type A sorting domain-containing protein [Ignavibacteriaceae bacterium]|nr:T9SS type A sorting domain-containing protein [Ignavibacteriaceae bacterium]